MKGKKLLLSKVLYYSGLLNIYSKFNSQNIVIFNYHRIYDNSLDTAFDRGVFGPSSHQFEMHMRWIRRNTDVLSLDQLIDIICNKKEITKLSSLVTFDDGYIDNYTLAYPILKRYDIPAIFFVPTDQINSRTLGWWDIIAFLINNSTKPYFHHEDKKYTFDNKEQVIRDFQQIKKTTPESKTKHLLNQLSETLEVDLPDTTIQSQELMSWQEIKEVSQNGITIGSHTHSHRVLSTIDEIEQETELTISKNILEKELGTAIRSIAYPVGNYQHFSEKTMSIASRCGYDIAFSFNTGVNYPNELEPYNIKRTEPPLNEMQLAATSLFPKIFV